MLIEHAYQKTVKATDRATMMNLIEWLNGYTLCSSIYSEKLSGDRFFHSLQNGRKYSEYDEYRIYH